jgi:pyridoxamine 5'-phosphate oxidase
MTDSSPIEHPSWLTSGDFADAAEPFQLFASWFEEAARTEPSDPNAMALATVDGAGLPDVRVVLLKGFDTEGFVFYTNRQSRKGEQLATNATAAADFHWKSLKRQVRIRGPVDLVSDEESDAYFATRPRDAQIGAWASQQSQPLERRLAFEKAIAYYGAKFAVGRVPRPPHWGGYRLAPISIEFWRDRPFRLHDRLEFRRDSIHAPWSKTRLFP